MNLADTTKTGESRIRGMIGVRDAVRALIDAQMDGCNDDTLHHLQAKLNTLYDRYTSKYGLLNSRGNDMAFSDDSSYPLLCALEILDEDGNLKAKADMFTKRTIRQESTVTHADTAVEALGISIGDRACVDLGFMSVLMGHPARWNPSVHRHLPMFRAHVENVVRGIARRDKAALGGWGAVLSAGGRTNTGEHFNGIFHRCAVSIIPAERVLTTPMDARLEGIDLNGDVGENACLKHQSFQGYTAKLSCRETTR